MDGDNGLGVSMIFVSRLWLRSYISFSPSTIWLAVCVTKRTFKLVSKLICVSLGEKNVVSFLLFKVDKVAPSLIGFLLYGFLFVKYARSLVITGYSRIWLGDVPITVSGRLVKLN